LPVQELEEEALMEVLEVTGISYPDARELPNKTGRPAAKHQKSPGGNSGSQKVRSRDVPRLTGKLLTEQQKIDQQITAENRMVLTLIHGKRKFIRESEYRKMMT
jgi:hypothetical protein